MEPFHSPMKGQPATGRTGCSNVSQKSNGRLNAANEFMRGNNAKRHADARS